jgi:hypothetical protein
LKELPEDVFDKVQEDVLPMVGQVPLPDDIDSFVLENILREEDSFEMDENEDSMSETEDNLLDLEDEDFLEMVPVEDVYQVLRKEKPIFQSFLISFLNEEKKGLIIELFSKDGVVPKAEFQKTAILEGIEEKIKTEFIQKIKDNLKTENKV